MAGKSSKWLTPFKKQCFVTLGVSLNMAQQGFVVGFAGILLPQLKAPGSSIPIDDSSGSWIASVLGFALVIGNFIVPSIMANYGRKTANLISIIPILVGWFCIVTAYSIPILLVARLLQGVSIGMSASAGPILIGEYTSPNNRGAFLTTISLGIATGVLIVHTVGAFLSWQKTALVCTCIAFVDLLIVIYSPESPSFLADQGRYEESRIVFRWLRGDDEEEELQRMIENSVIVKESKSEVDLSQSFLTKCRRNFVYLYVTIKKKEFYKPIFIMMHIYTLGQWGGANMISSYTADIYNTLIGPGLSIPLMVFTVDAQRIVSNACAVYVIRKIKRRTMLGITIGLNIFAYLSEAAYSYSKINDLLPFDHPLIGVCLIHVHMLSIATGTVPLPFIIAGELFPLEYRSLAGGISVLFLSSNMFLTIKTFPFLFNTLGLYGAYCLYAGIVGYFLVVALVLMPETKDRTLQDIEDEFRGRPLSPEEMKEAQSLTSLKTYKLDRRCSAPII